MNDVLHLLLTGSEHLRDQCLIMQDAGAADYRLHTQQVIKAAYDIAKCAKQLVMLFE
jgi:G protein-coupled receptor kinase-interacting protein 1 C term